MALLSFKFLTNNFCLLVPRLTRLHQIFFGIVNVLVQSNCNVSLESFAQFSQRFLVGVTKTKTAIGCDCGVFHVEHHCEPVIIHQTWNHPIHWNHPILFCLIAEPIVQQFLNDIFPLGFITVRECVPPCEPVCAKKNGVFVFVPIVEHLQKTIDMIVFHPNCGIHQLSQHSLLLLKFLNVYLFFAVLIFFPLLLPLLHNIRFHNDRNVFPHLWLIPSVIFLFSLALMTTLIFGFIVIIIFGFIVIIIIDFVFSFSFVPV